MGFDEWMKSRFNLLQVDCTLMKRCRAGGQGHRFSRASLARQGWVFYPFCNFMTACFSWFSPIWE